MVHEPVKIAVIGCGGYAFQLIKRILSVPHSGAIVAVTSRDTDSSGARYCRERGIRIFQTVEELLDYGQFDAVINPTPIHLHAAITKQCLTAGFPVWMEKPPVATVQELDDLAGAAKTAGLPVAVCFNALYSQLQQQLKKELVSGRFGAVRRIKSIGAWIRTDAYFSRNSWAGKLQQNGKWILDGDINNPFAHVLCNNLFFAARDQHALAEPLEIEAELYRANTIESEDTSSIRIMTRDGVEVLSWFTLAAEKEIQPLTVIETDRAVIELEDFSKLKISFSDGTVESHESYQENRIEMLQQLCRTVRTGERPLCDLDMCRPFVTAVNSAFDSTGTIGAVPERYLSRETGDRTVIDGISESMMQVFRANALFSESGVPWARKSGKFNADKYNCFPVRFQFEPDFQDELKQGVLV